jgi:hypothetical protein
MTPSLRWLISAPPPSSGTTDHGATRPAATVVGPPDGRHHPVLDSADIVGAGELAGGDSLVALGGIVASGAL